MSASYISPRAAAQIAAGKGGTKSAYSSKNIILVPSTASPSSPVGSNTTLEAPSNNNQQQNQQQGQGQVTTSTYIKGEEVPVSGGVAQKLKEAGIVQTNETIDTSPNAIYVVSRPKPVSSSGATISTSTQQKSIDQPYPQDTYNNNQQQNLSPLQQRVKTGLEFSDRVTTLGGILETNPNDPAHVKLLKGTGRVIPGTISLAITSGLVLGATIEGVRNPRERELVYSTWKEIPGKIKSGELVQKTFIEPIKEDPYGFAGEVAGIALIGSAGKISSSIKRGINKDYIPTERTGIKVVKENAKKIELPKFKETTVVDYGEPTVDIKAGEIQIRKSPYGNRIQKVQELQIYGKQPPIVKVDKTLFGLVKKETVIRPQKEITGTITRGTDINTAIAKQRMKITFDLTESTYPKGYQNKPIAFIGKDVMAKNVRRTAERTRDIIVVKKIKPSNRDITKDIGPRIFTAKDILGKPEKIDTKVNKRYSSFIKKDGLLLRKPRLRLKQPKMKVGQKLQLRTQRQIQPLVKSKSEFKLKMRTGLNLKRQNQLQMRTQSQTQSRIQIQQQVFQPMQLRKVGFDTRQGLRLGLKPATVTAQARTQKPIQQQARMTAFRMRQRQETSTKKRSPTTKLLIGYGYKSPSGSIFKPEKFSQKTRYTPSVAAISLGIRSKRSKVKKQRYFTGFEVRPI